MEEEVKIDKSLLKVFQADTRLDILKKLQERQMTASELSKVLGKHVTTISEHLQMLENKNLVQKIERPGRKWIYYKLTKTGEKIIQPKTYHFTFGFFASIIAIAGGILLLPNMTLDFLKRAEPLLESSQEIAIQAKDVPTNALVDFIPSIILLVAGIFLLTYILYKRQKRKMKV